MPWVPYGHIPEETTICSQDAVHLGPHLPSQPYHAPCPPVPAPWAPSWEEVGRHVIQSCRRQCRHYLLLPLISLWLFQVCIEVPCHQQIQSPVAIFERCDDTLYCWGVIGGEVTSDDVPSLLPSCHLEADNIWPELLNELHRIPRWRPVKHCNSAAVSTWRNCSNDAVSIPPTGVTSTCQLGLL